MANGGASANTYSRCVGAPGRPSWAGLSQSGLVADKCQIKPGTIPAGLEGNQLLAYLEGYAAAAAWTSAAAAFDATSLRSDLLVSFSRGWDDYRAEDAHNERAS
jgi:hypothetical protein